MVQEKKMENTILDQFWKKTSWKKIEIKTCRKIEIMQFLKKSRNTTILEKTSWKRAQEKKLEKIPFATKSGKNHALEKTYSSKGAGKEIGKIQFLTNSGKTQWKTPRNQKAQEKKLEKNTRQ